MNVTARINPHAPAQLPVDAFHATAAPTARRTRPSAILATREDSEAANGRTPKDNRPGRSSLTPHISPLGPRRAKRSIPIADAL